MRARESSVGRQFNAPARCFRQNYLTTLRERLACKEWMDGCDLRAVAAAKDEFGHGAHGVRRDEGIAHHAADVGDHLQAVGLRHGSHAPAPR